MRLSDVLDLRQGEAIEILSQMPADSVDAVLADPPYGLDITRLNGGTRWDRGSPSFKPDLWSEVRRVIKNGASVASFGHPRTVHRMAVAMEEAGLQITDTLYWAKGHSNQTGNQDLEKAIARHGTDDRGEASYLGWTTHIRPAVEPIIVARRLDDGQSLSSAIAAGGVGGFHSDPLRVGDGGEDRSRKPGAFSGGHALRIQRSGTEMSVPHAGGRMPTNLILEHNQDCDENGCSPTCPALTIDAGGRQKYRPGKERASRFFSQIQYSGRATPGGHPTAKPDGISNWLASLIVRPDSVVLDLFSGGGSLAIAAARAGARRVIAVEREAQYCELVRQRFETLVIQ